MTLYVQEDKAKKPQSVTFSANPGYLDELIWIFKNMKAIRKLMSGQYHIAKNPPKGAERKRRANGGIQG